MTDDAVVSLQNVSKYYHRGSETVHALEDVSLSIGAGEYVAVLGHSGSGKTTLMNIMGCLDRPSQGTVQVRGRSIEQATERELAALRKRTVGFVFQQFFLIPTLTVIQNVQLPALFAGKNADARARELLEQVGLSGRVDHRPSQLSGGEMQRVAIARSLINEPSILLADEPTGNLDSKNAAAVMELFESFNRRGMTVIVVTHNVHLVRHCTRTVNIEDGKLSVA